MSKIEREIESNVTNEHQHRFIYISDYPMITKCGNKTLPNAIWLECVYCRTPHECYKK